VTRAPTRATTRKITPQRFTELEFGVEIHQQKDPSADARSRRAVWRHREALMSWLGGDVARGPW
jgi:hypothetical protein